MAVTGQSAIEAMRTQMKMPDWDDVLVLGVQLNPMPLDEHAEVSLQTVIGKHTQTHDYLYTDFHDYIKKHPYLCLHLYACSYYFYHKHHESERKKDLVLRGFRLIKSKNTT